MNNTTKDGILVQVGQTWERLGKQGMGRKIRVIGVHNGTAQFNALNDDGSVETRVTKIAVRRLRPNSVGFRLLP